MAFKPEVSGSCINPGGDATARSWPARANNGAYPGGYYAVMRILVVDSVAQSLFLMRMASWVACLALFAGSATFLRGQDRWRTPFMWLVVSVPLGLFLFASTNPSGVATAAVAATFASVFAAFAATTIRRIWGPTALGCTAIAIASGTRPDAILFCAIAVLAAGLAAEAWRPARRPQALIAGSSVGVVLVAAFLLRDSGVVVPAGGRTSEGPSVAHNLVRLPLLYVGDFATNLGWLDTHMPRAVWGSIALALSILVLLGLRGISVGRGATLALLVCAGVAIPLLLLEQAGAGVGNEVQPRYLLPLVMIAAGVLAVSPEESVPGSTRLPWLVVAGLATVANSVALHTTLRRYLTGTDVTSWNLNSDPEWWWGLPSPRWECGLRAVTFAAAAVCLVALLAPAKG